MYQTYLETKLEYLETKHQNTPPHPCNHADGNQHGGGKTCGDHGNYCADMKTILSIKQKLQNRGGHDGFDNEDVYRYKIEKYHEKLVQNTRNKNIDKALES